MRTVKAMVVVLALVGVIGCRGAQDEPVAPFELATSPEFVNRLIPGRRPLALVEVSGAAGGTVALVGASSLAGSTVSIEPAGVTPGGSSVAEVWLAAPDVSEDTPITVTVTGSRAGTERSVTVTATITPGIDDLEPTATDIAAVFLEQLGGEVPGLPPDVTGLTGGTPVAGLLVVTHYAWFTDDVEIDLAWHVMVAPDDWA